MKKIFNDSLSYILFLGALMGIMNGCSSYINSYHHQLDQADKDERSLDLEDEHLNQFTQYKKNYRKSSVVYNNPEMRSTKTTKYLPPKVKREYRDEKEAMKRVKADDLTDNGNDGSLWSPNDQGAFLFSSNKHKNSGDIVRINVQPKLKNEITMELKKEFPDNPFENKSNPQKPGAQDPKNPDPNAPAKPGEENRGVASVANDQAKNDPKALEGGQDKISSVIIEEINREHLLVRGRKFVLYKNRKRTVEVQALVARSSIDESDLINSDDIIEQTVKVIK